MVSVTVSATIFFMCSGLLSTELSWVQYVSMRVSTIVNRSLRKMPVMNKHTFIIIIPQSVYIHTYIQKYYIHTYIHIHTYHIGINLMYILLLQQISIQLILSFYTHYLACSTSSLPYYLQLRYTYKCCYLRTTIHTSLIKVVIFYC